MADNDDTPDILLQIRDALGDLPDKLAATLRAGRQTRFAAISGAADTEGLPSQWHAAENFLGAAGNFVPALGDVAGLMRDARALHEAWQQLAAAFSSPSADASMATPATHLPIAPPIVEQAAPETFGMRPAGWTPPLANEPLTAHPPGYETIQGDWREHQLADNEFLVDDATMEEFRRKMAAMRGEQTLPFAPDWTPSEPPASPQLPEPFELKADDWRPQPFEVIQPDDWKPSAERAEPGWMSRSPEIGFADWQPQERPDIAALEPYPPPLELLPSRTIPEGWEDVRPLLPIREREGWMPPSTPGIDTPAERAALLPQGESSATDKYGFGQLAGVASSPSLSPPAAHLAGDETKTAGLLGDLVGTASTPPAAAGDRPDPVIAARAENGAGQEVAALVPAAGRDEDYHYGFAGMEWGGSPSPWPLVPMQPAGGEGRARAGEVSEAALQSTATGEPSPGWPEPYQAQPETVPVWEPATKAWSADERAALAQGRDVLMERGEHAPPDWPEREAAAMLGGDDGPETAQAKTGEIENALEKLADVGRELIAALRERAGSGEEHPLSPNDERLTVPTHRHEATTTAARHQGGADESIEQSIDFARILGKVLEIAG